MFRLTFKCSMSVVGSTDIVENCNFFYDFDVLPAALFWIDSNSKAIKDFQFISLIKIDNHETQKK